MEKQLKEVDKWNNVRSKLDNNYSHSEDWETAISIFDARIKDKYISPIDNLIGQNIRKGEGFVIVTIQCALIEAFAAFKEGLIYNHNKPSEGGLSYEYKESRELFVRFLNSENVFKDIFYVKNNGGKQLNTPFSANQFYSQVRCSLMHEARTKGTWHINATKKDDINDKRFIKQKSKGNIIYRTLFQKVISDYFVEYKNQLKSTNETSNVLRRYFARKMDDLYGIKDGKEWWSEE
jgi:hypothetical protein